MIKPFQNYSRCQGFLCHYSNRNAVSMRKEISQKCNGWSTSTLMLYLFTQSALLFLSHNRLSSISLPSKFNVYLLLGHRPPNRCRGVGEGPLVIRFKPVPMALTAERLEVPAPPLGLRWGTGEHLIAHHLFYSAFMLSTNISMMIS